MKRTYEAGAQHNKWQAAAEIVVVAVVFAAAVAGSTTLYGVHKGDGLNLGELAKQVVKPLVVTPRTLPDFKPTH